MNPKKLNSRETATVFGATPNDVAQWVKDGCPCRRTGGVRSPLEFDSAKLHAWLVERAAFEGDPDAAQAAKLRDSEASAQLKEYKVAELRGQTITRTDAIAIYSEHVGEFRTRLFEMPDQVSDLSATQRADLEHAINRALAEFSGLPEPDAPLEGEDALVDFG